LEVGLDTAPSGVLAHLAVGLGDATTHTELCHSNDVDAETGSKSCLHKAWGHPLKL